MQSHVLVLAIMASLVLAGCSEPTEPLDGTEDPQDPQDPGADPGTDPGSNGSDANQTNQPPTAELTASVVNGSAPLNVTFTLDGSDPDGDPLTWVLTSNGTEIANGDALPADVAHVFEVGNVTVVLSVSDGSVTATANVTIEAFAGAAGPAPVDQVFEGTITGAYAEGYTHDPVVHTYALPSAPSTMTVHLTWARTDGAFDLDVYIYDPAGNQVAAGNNYNDPVLGDDKEEELVVIDDADALSRLGEWRFEVVSAGSVESDYSLAVTFA